MGRVALCSPFFANAHRLARSDAPYPSHYTKPFTLLRTIRVVSGSLQIAL